MRKPKIYKVFVEFLFYVSFCISLVFMGIVFVVVAVITIAAIK